MTSEGGHDGPGHDDFQLTSALPSPTVEIQLVESLIHHLIEKGVLTRNDALSVVQSVAEVKRGTLEEHRSAAALADLAILKKLYSSFELISDLSVDLRTVDGSNLVQLRPPLHRDRPGFPTED